MTDYFLRAAGGNWNVNATWSTVGSGSAVNAGTFPGSADRAILENGSGALTINVASACRGFDCQAGTGNYNNTVTQSAGLTVGDGTLPTGNIAFRLSATTTWTRTTGNLTFSSTAGTGTAQTFNFAGKTTAGNITFGTAGNSSSYVWGGGLAGTAALIHTGGVLDFSSGSYAVAAASFASNSGSTRNLKLGNAAFTLSSATSPWSVTAASLTFDNTNTASITITGTSNTFGGGGFTYGGTYTVASAQAPHAITGANTFGAMAITGTAAQTNIYTFDSNTTITNNFAAAGNSAANNILIRAATEGTAITITAGSVTLTDVQFEDITAAGAAAPFTGTRIGDWHGNTNITFTTGINKFLVSGNANTTMATSVHFATTSGGATAANNYPLPQDTLKADTNTGWTTGPRTLTTTANQRHPSYDNTAMTQNQTITQWQTVGNMALHATRTTTCQPITFRGRVSTTTFTGTNNALAWQGGVINVDATIPIATQVTIQNLASTITTDLNINGGNVVTSVATIRNLTGAGLAGVSKITFGFFTTTTVTGFCKLNFTTSVSPTLGALVLTGTCSDYISYVDQNMIALTIQTGATTMNIQSSGLAGSTTYPGVMTIAAPRTLAWFSNVAAYGLTFALDQGGWSGSGISYLNAVGSAGNIITVQVTTVLGAPQFSMFTKPSRTVCVDYWAIRDSAVSGGATFSAGTHSTDNGNNSGWVFTACPVTTVTVTDSFGLTDARVSSVTKVQGDSMGLTDATQKSVTHIHTDTLGLTDTRVNRPTAQPRDSFGITDARVSSPTARPTDSLGLTDVTQKNLVHYHRDDLGITDRAVSSPTAQPRDDLGMTDATQKSLVHYHTDSFGMTDSRLNQIIATISDNFGLADATVKELVHFIADTLGLTDFEVAMLAAQPRDSFGLIDALQKSLVHYERDDIGLTDAAVSNPIAQPLDSFGMTEPPTISAITAVVANTFGLQDASISSLNITLDDLFGMEDENHANLNVVIADPLGMSDDTAADLAIVVTDVFGMEDDPSVAIDVVLSDGFGLTDIYNSEINVIVADLFGVLDDLDIELIVIELIFLCLGMVLDAPTADIDILSPMAEMTISRPLARVTVDGPRATIDLGAPSVTITFEEC